MGKTKRGNTSTSAWTASDHDLRKAKRQRKLGDKLEEKETRTALLTRDTKAKRNEGKLRLHIVRVQRQMEQLRARLVAWDDVEEKAREKKEAEERERQQEKETAPKQRYRRPGPETWQLRGAARPAWQVYDFDTRYVDPHIKAHEDAKQKHSRSRNVLELYKGRFGEEHGKDGPPQPYCRDFLALLMQMGLLQAQAKKMKSARAAFLECMELDSADQPVTPARCHLMRLYMDMNRPDSARRLWERLSPLDPSVWIRYSAALVEFVSWKILKEDGSTQESAESVLSKAIRANVFCVYYLAFFDMFQQVMEYTDEIEDAHEGESLEEAIEYCSSEQMGAWQGTEGALEWVKDVVVRALNGDSVASGQLSSHDLEWREKLKDVVQQNVSNGESSTDSVKSDEGSSASIGQDEDDDADERDSIDQDEDEDADADADEPVADVAMFAGMFQTSMEMVEDSGKLKKR
jgi:tetratricopeptide (TPR) repeat protein